MRSLLLFFLISLGVFQSFAQGTSSPPVVMNATFSNPFPLVVAPGQLLTLLVQSSAGAVTASDVAAVFWTGSDEPMPVLQVSQVSPVCLVVGNVTCPNLLAVTVQIPFDIPVPSLISAGPLNVQGNIAISVNGTRSAYIGAQTMDQHVHFLTRCDVIVGGMPSFPTSGGLPCSPLVVHGDGTPVSVTHPAVGGEELVAYATGLGQTNPPLAAGQPATQTIPTLVTFGIDFNYHTNALAASPGNLFGASPTPLFTGATKGYIGLYQINSIVPPPPPGLPSCGGFQGTFSYGIQSNLTVSVGSNFSFDGAGICVQPGS